MEGGTPLEKDTRFTFEIDNDSWGITPVENGFIDLYMPAARGDYVKVYLYGLKQCFSHRAVPINNVNLSQLFDITEGDVQKAWAYWQKEGILSIDYRADGSAVVHYFNITSVVMDGGRHRAKPAEDIPAAPVPTEEDDLADPRVAAMFEKIQAMVGSDLLSPGQMRTILSWKNDYGFEPEAIVLLAEYSLTLIAGKSNTFSPAQTLKYMESVAAGWQDHGVVTYDDAERFIQQSRERRKQYYDIFKYLGLRRNPIAWERQMMGTWFDGYGYGMDIITAALNRSTKPDIRYIDGILRRWRDQGYTTLAEVEAERKQKSGPAAAGTPAGTPADPDTLKREEWLDQMDQQAAEAIWRLYDENNTDQSE